MKISFLNLPTGKNHIFYIMLLTEYRTVFFKELGALYDEYETESFFYIILEDFHHMKRVDLALNPTFELTPEMLHQWENIVAQLKENRPIQYILGETEFYGLPFYVNEFFFVIF